MNTITFNNKNIKAYKWELIVLLWFAFFFNQADRQIFNVVIPSIKSDLGLDDAQIGLVASILVLTYGILVPITGYIGDRYDKKKIIFFSLLFWSTATLFTGSSTLLIHLVLLRGLATGGGEAFYAPAANALISEYHNKTRATAMSIHQTAVYTGIILSGLITGYIAETFGWRYAFFTFGGGGIILAIIIYFRMKPSKPQVSTNDEEKVSIQKALPVFFKKPTAILLAFAFAGMVFTNVGYLTWMPTYLYEEFGQSLTSAGFNSMFYHHVLAYVGLMFFAALSDKLMKKRDTIRLEIQGLSLLLGAPAIYFMGVSKTVVGVYIGLAVFGIFRGGYDSNIFAALYDVIEPKYRSSATGIMLMFAFVTGASAPYILGLMKPVLGLSNALASLSIAYVFAALCIFVALKVFYDKDKIME
ncbi:MFS transporter [Chondrinema litorale]|uniref:MFS transporter n=1 Tax=Chondrinema litorale TaxID=2994555 RepID=UPI0025434053|nr:MFS transporter [Chondrinema litorale]UZR99553.1 MFS transporter [Chondrinema litorale]